MAQVKRIEVPDDVMTPEESDRYLELSALMRVKLTD
jgi:hypothetical protein